VALVRDTPLSSCGCFGEPDTPPTNLHVAINVFLSVAAWMAFAHPVGGLPATIAGDASQGLVLAGLIGLATYAVVTALTALPRLSAIGALR
jgi:hypothetical protein